eukprot:symbB.v1.2.011925.t1/scaffold809.1/size160600/4
MPTLSPLAIGRPAWTSTAEQRLWSLLHSGHPAAVDTLVAELADTLHITVEQARGFRDFQYGKWPSSNQ